MNLQNLKTIEECDKCIEALRLLGNPIPGELLDHRALLVRQGVTVYGDFKARNNPSPELTACIERTAEALLDQKVSAEDVLKPVMLYGKIQSGKTRAFVGILSIAFDRGVDIAVVYTKGTNALAKQTVSRMKAEFANFKPGNNLRQKCTIAIHDILDLKGLQLTQYQLDTQKHIIVCKKEAKNTSWMRKVFAGNVLMRQKRVVVIDDEADFGGISFHKNAKLGGVEAGRNALNITETVKLIPDCRNLLVTATPYSLYLQPEGVCKVVNGEVKPMKPRHTELVPVFSRYVGGKQYFVDAALEDSMFHSVFHPLSTDCIKVLGHRDLRYLKNVASSPNLKDFRYAVLQYLLGTAVRSIQEELGRKKLYRSSLIMHVEIAKAAHKWQSEIMEAFLEYLRGHVFCECPDDASFDDTVVEIYDDFCLTRKKGFVEKLLTTDTMPSLGQVRDKINLLFASGAIHVQIVNSDADVEGLLNASGQLELSHEANIFVGGSILDRGITIENLIGFIYGRSPKTMQMDTVLQHARMYGARAMDDMAATRFHTTYLLYDRLKRINAMDELLREEFGKALETGRDPQKVFVCREPDGTIMPCAANKLLMASVSTISPHSRYLPIGFQTDCDTKIHGIVSNIDSTLLNSPDYKNRDENGIFKIDRKVAIDLLRKIRKTYIYDRPVDENKGLDWDVEEMIGVLEWALDKNDELYCLRRENRELNRCRENGGFADAPDDGHGDLGPARKKAIDRPVLMFIRENGSKDKGWRGAPCYWPVLVVQAKVRAAVYGKADPSVPNEEVAPTFGDEEWCGQGTDEQGKSLFDLADTLAVDRGGDDTATNPHPNKCQPVNVKKGECHDNIS